MKRIVTIVMLVLLLYNAVGYYIVFHFQHIKAEEEFQEYINSTLISDNELTLFKIPVAEYASKGSKDFDRIEGDFEQNGKFYEVVKQRLENDTVLIYCINNEKEEALYAQLTDHINTHISGGKTHKNNKSEKSFQNLLKEYLPRYSNNIECSIDCQLTSKVHFDHNKSLRSISANVLTPPPELV